MSWRLDKMKGEPIHLLCSAMQGCLVSSQISFVAGWAWWFTTGTTKWLFKYTLTAKSYKLLRVHQNVKTSNCCDTPIPWRYFQPESEIMALLVKIKRIHGSTGRKGRSRVMFWNEWNARLSNWYLWYLMKNEVAIDSICLEMIGLIRQRRRTARILTTHAAFSC